MGNGWHEWPLVLFTVLGQCVAGAVIVSGLGLGVALRSARSARAAGAQHVLYLAIDGNRFFLLLSCISARRYGHLTH